MYVSATACEVQKTGAGPLNLESQEFWAANIGGENQTTKARAEDGHWAISPALMVSFKPKALKS